MLMPVFIKVNKSVLKLDLLTIVFIGVEDNNVKFFMTDKTYFMVRSTMTEALKKLPPDIFLRTHDSWAVSVFHIEAIDRKVMTISDDQYIPIAPRFYKPLIEKLRIIGWDDKPKGQRPKGE